MRNALIVIAALLTASAAHGAAFMVGTQDARATGMAGVSADISKSLVKLFFQHFRVDIEIVDCCNGREFLPSACLKC